MWTDLQQECEKYARPSTFAQKIRMLNHFGYLFVLPPQQPGDDKLIVIPEEFLSRARQLIQKS